MTRERFETIQDVVRTHPSCRCYYTDDAGRVGFRVMGHIHWWTEYPLRGWVPTGFDMRLGEGTTRHDITKGKA